MTLPEAIFYAACVIVGVPIVSGILWVLFIFLVAFIDGGPTVRLKRRPTRLRPRRGSTP